MGKLTHLYLFKKCGMFREVFPLVDGVESHPHDYFSRKFTVIIHANITIRDI